MAIEKVLLHHHRSRSRSHRTLVELLSSIAIFAVVVAVTICINGNKSSNNSTMGLLLAATAYVVPSMKQTAPIRQQQQQQQKLLKLLPYSHSTTETSGMFTNLRHSNLVLSLQQQQTMSGDGQNDNVDDDMSVATTTIIIQQEQQQQLLLPVLLVLPIVVMCLFPTTAMAADASFQPLPSIPPVWNSALLAYSHYFFILLGTILLCYERFTVTANMSVETEKSLVIADALYGVVGAALATSGYFRVISEYGKGWDYYAHEPLFWVKLSAAGLLAGLSLFPTITFIKRGSKLFQNETIEPMSDALANRVRKVLNAELSAILSVPLLASLMARGVSYNQDFPWQVGAAITVLTLVGSGAVYARQALNWMDPLES